MQIKCSCGWKQKLKGRMHGWPEKITCSKCKKTLLTNKRDPIFGTAIVNVLTDAYLEMPASERISHYT